ncbi:MAG: hypothetical protein HDR95_06385 [Bacteroides sp.]|nr:hypothetical protein [Bacteroides sp.]
MSKAKLKKALAALDKDQIIETALELYDARKDAKEWFEFWLDPDARKACEKAKTAVRRIFYTGDNPRRRPSMTNLNKIIKDFTTVCFDRDEVADFLLYVGETETEWLESRYRRISYRSSLKKNIDTAALYIENNFPDSQYDLRLERLRNRANALYVYAGGF